MRQPRLACFALVLLGSLTCCNGDNANEASRANGGAYIPPNESTVQEYIQPDVLDVLRHGDEFRVYSLNRETWRDWHRDDSVDGLLGEALEHLKDPDWVIGSFSASGNERRDVLQALYAGIGQGTGQRDCFYPTYAIHGKKDNAEVLVLICSVCGCVVALDESSRTVVRRPMPVHKDFCVFMDGLLDDHWIRSSR